MEKSINMQGITFGKQATNQIKPMDIKKAKTDGLG